jgi:hypothetical protein
MADLLNSAASTQSPNGEFEVALRMAPLHHQSRSAGQDPGDAPGELSFGHRSLRRFGLRGLSRRLERKLLLDRLDLFDDGALGGAVALGRKGNLARRMAWIAGRETIVSPTLTLTMR